MQPPLSEMNAKSQQGKFHESHDYVAVEVVVRTLNEKDSVWRGRERDFHHPVIVITIIVMRESVNLLLTHHPPSVSRNVCLCSLYPRSDLPNDTLLLHLLLPLSSSEESIIVTFIPVFTDRTTVLVPRPSFVLSSARRVSLIHLPSFCVPRPVHRQTPIRRSG